MFWPHQMMGAGWGGWIIGGLLTLLVLAGLIALVFLVVRASSSATQSKRGGDSSGETALDILQRRYARGEIDKAEYEAKRRHIEE
jgi:putative membrane protein